MTKTHIKSVQNTWVIGIGYVADKWQHTLKHTLEWYKTDKTHIISDTRIPITAIKYHVKSSIIGINKSIVQY